MNFGPADTYSVIRSCFPALSEEAGHREADFVDRIGADILTPRTGSMPPRLYGLPGMPRALFRLGRCQADGPHIVSMVGTRRATASGIEFCNRFVARLAELCPDAIVVSGLAYGIDVAAHRAALSAGLDTVAVVAHGLDTLYPADHRDVARRMIDSGRGALITEYLSGTPAHRGNFLARNRIVAALSAATVVVESGFSGGSLYTARLAREIGRPVFAVPGRWNDRQSAGTNRLIADGHARLITDADQFMEAMHWEPASKSAAPQPPSLDFTDLQGNALLIARHLREHPDHSMHDLVAALGLTVAEISARITEMEMDDLLTVLPGDRFQLNF